MLSLFPLTVAGGGGRDGFEICLLIGVVFWLSVIGFIGTGPEISSFGRGGRNGGDFCLDLDIVPFNVFILSLKRRNRLITLEEK